MIAPQPESVLVLLTDANGRPFAVRNTSVLTVERWENWKTARDKTWAYDDVVCVIVPDRDDREYYTIDGDKAVRRKKWVYIPVKGPLEDVVFALNQGVHMHK